MKDPERQEHAARQATEALRTHLEPSCIGIVGIADDDPDELGLASGTVIEIAGRVFAATCAHFLNDYANDEIVIVGVGLPPVRIVGRGTRGGGRTDLLDVGWLELEGVPAGRAIGIDRVRLDDQALDDDLVVVAGCPADRLPRERLKRREVAVGSVYYLTNTLSESEYGHRLPPTKMVLSYPEAGNQLLDGSEQAHMFSPKGMSGGGVWRCQFGSPKNVWAPDRASLVAIQISWLEDRRVLFAQQIAHWLEMLGEDLPELAEHLPRRRQ